MQASARTSVPACAAFQSRVKARQSASRPGTKLSPTRQMRARMPSAANASPPAAGKSYMSATAVVPPASISIAPQRAPARTSSAVMRASTGKIASSSQRWSGSPPPSPRTSVIAVWPWQFTRPGSTSRDGVPGASAGASRTAVITPFSKSTEPRMKRWPGTST